MTAPTQYLVSQPFNGTVRSTITDGRVDFSGYLYNNRGENLTIEEYRVRSGYHDVVAVDEDELERLIDQHNKSTYLDAPAKEITFEQYMNYLESMPPAHYVSRVDFERFNMTERTAGIITQQVVRVGRRYFTLYIDVTDHTTWVTPANAHEKLATAMQSQAA